MKNYTRTDLASESVGAAELAEGELQKICRHETLDGFEVTRVTVEEEAHSTLLGKPRGNYVTVEFGKVAYLAEDERERLVLLLAREIRNMCRACCGTMPDRDFSVLVVGLGNEEITADAIGPRAARQLTATRHLRHLDSKLYDTVGRCEISVLFTGVLGQTGMEAVELVCGAVERVKPRLVLAVDALAARSVERLASTVQLCDSGIAPGSGVGNERGAISLETVGVPVLALGVPTVVDSSTLVWDALAEAGIVEVSKTLERVLENGRSFFVTPKESDVITEHVAALLADAVDCAFCVEA
ncbi:MAG: GPR endopeptidase [Ruminococcaceae bacterium]|nr:GPR endopeptidase [Oscillospiraceae bacterium]